MKNSLWQKLSLISLLSISPVIGQEIQIKIGQAGPLTGEQSVTGKEVQFAVKLALDELNEKKIKLGGKTIKFELIAENDDADEQTAATVAKKLVQSKIVGIIGHLNSGASIAASKTYADAGIVQISPASTATQYTQQGFKTTFRVLANDGQLGSRLGSYAINVLKSKKIVVIDDQTAYGKGIAAEFTKSAKKFNATIVFDQSITDKTTDFSQIVKTLKEKGADLVFLGGVEPQAGHLLQELHKNNLKIKLLGGDGICNENLSQFANGNILDEQVYCAEASGIEGSRRGLIEAFKTKFKQKFGMESVTHGPYAYDSVMVMVEAMKRADSTDPKRYIDKLRNIDYDGITGKISFDNNGDIKNGAMTLYTYKNKKRVSLSVIR